VNWVSLGLIDYQPAWELQRQIADLRADGALDDTVLALQHPHTYTLGRSGDIRHLLMSAAERERRHVAVFEVDRGGDITYHGPGQLVAYPILALGQPGPDGRLPQLDYVGYLRRLEAVIIETLRPFGMAGRREEGLTGVWVDTPAGLEKIAAIGVKVTAAGVSMHGLALNVDPDLSYFAGIIPCGIADKGVTSMGRLLGRAAPTMAEVEAQFRIAFGDVFEEQLHEVLLADLLERRNQG
jgi:lipoate-protein ligase B